MLGNARHLPTARFILFVLLASCNVIPVPPSCPLPWSSNLNPLGSRPIERAARVWLNSGLQWVPKEPSPLELANPSENTDEHLHWALGLDSNRLHFSPNNPCLDWALKFGQSMGPSLVSWREEVVQDVARLREELQAEQEEWLQSAPEHVRQVYRQGGEHFVLQPLVVLHLLALFEFPGTSEIADELQFGFKVLGTLPQGTNWEVRQDAKYSRPLTRPQFEALNSAHKRSLSEAASLPSILGRCYKKSVRNGREIDFKARSTQPR